MEIKTTGQIWIENTQREPTADYWGREGRGIDLVWFESKDPKKQWVSIESLQQLLDEGIKVRQEGFNKSTLNLFDEGYYRALTHIQLKIEETLRK